jgi:uncharacterized membrane protein required for colicin V production
MHIPQGRIAVMLIVIAVIVLLFAVQHRGIVLIVLSVLSIIVAFFGIWLDGYVSKRVANKIHKEQTDEKHS